MQSLEAIKFVDADVLGSPETSPSVISALHRTSGSGNPPRCDVLISNPPYISSKAYRTTIARSVRDYEPKLALVPTELPGSTKVDDGDVFYPRLLELAKQLQTQVVLFEVADMEQAKRVVSMAIEQGEWTGIEIWKDEPGVHDSLPQHVTVQDRTVEVRGIGHGRSVFAYRGRRGDFGKTTV